MSNIVPTWDEFINQNLLRLRVTSGVVLMSHLGTVSYRYGDLMDVPQDEFKQFINLFTGRSTSDNNTEADSLFTGRSTSDNNTEADSGFCLKLSGRQTHFTAFRKSYCSIYCASRGDHSGLVICNLPYGILLCTYHHPVHCVQATSAIESFCEKLRA